MGENRHNKFFSILKMFLKAVIAIAVILWLYRNQQFSQWQDVLQKFKFSALIPAVIFSIASIIMSSFRWRELASTLGINLSRTKALSLTTQGMFFSLVIPGGAIGGDVIKMAAVSGCVNKGNRTEGIFSIIIDRIVGMIALFSLALILLLFHRQSFCELSINGIECPFAGLTLWWIFTGVCAAGLSAGCAIFFHRKIFAIPGIKQIIAFLDRRSNGKITRISTAMDLYSRNRDRLFLWVLLTMITIHLAPAMGMIFLLSGCGYNFLPVTAVFTAVIIGNIVALVPLFPGGIGVRDALTIALLVAGGCPPEIAAAVQLLATLLIVAGNLSGALFFIFDRKFRRQEDE